MIDAYYLPVIFVGLMGLAIVVYAILDGYDLGVGILLPLVPEDESKRDTMIASIGPFWDANETWLVLAVGIMLIAFPAAHSIVLFHLYIPVLFMLIGLILRGVAFDFRAKAAIAYKPLWDKVFKAGSLLTSLSQGFMLGMYVVGFEYSYISIAFCVLSALGVTAAYTYIGAAWLIMKTEQQLQKQAITWALWAGRATFVGVLAVSAVNPIVNPLVFERWFAYPLVSFILVIPVLCFAAFLANEIVLKQLPKTGDRYCWLPFILVMCIFTLSFTALAFSFFPYIVPGTLTVWQAASATESLAFIFVGTVIVVPIILLYTVFAYRVFYGKARPLDYY